MFDKIAEKMSDNIVKSGFAQNDDKELYLFGIQQGLVLLLNIGTTVTIGLVSGTLWELTFFTAALIALRSYSGGYHAKTPQKCYIVSTLVMVVAALLIKFVVLHTLVYTGILILAGIFIIVFSPIDSENNPLDEQEKKVYRKRAVIICITEEVLSFILLHTGLKNIAVCVIWNLAAVSLMMAVAKAAETFKHIGNTDNKPGNQTPIIQSNMSGEK